MKLVPGLKAFLYTNTASVSSTDELIDSLIAVLPIVLAVARHAWVSLPEDDTCECSRTTIQRQFYENFNVQTVTLLGALETFDIDSTRGAAGQLDNALLKVHDALENSCTSWTSAAGIKACRLAGVERCQNESYSKLRALGRLQPHGCEVSDATARNLAGLIHLCSSKAERRRRMLSSINKAFSVLENLQLFDKEAEYHCPVRFSDYPFKHVRRLSTTLFSAIEKCWRCNCNVPLHLERAMKLNLTHHQHFDTERRYDRSFSQKQALFRIMFPTSLENPQWRDTDVAVRDIDPLLEAAMPIIDNKLCRIVEDAKASVVPNMVVHQKQLWQLQAEIETSSPIKIPDCDFKTLRELLDETSGGRNSLICSTAFEDRITLSFILVTSFIHLLNVHHHGLQATLTARNVCFYVKQRSFNIMKPYLNLHFQQPQSQSTPRNLNVAHWFPDILSLGILLLEIFCGRELSFPSSEDRCAVALAIYDRWSARSGKSCASTIPQGCFQAVIACIDPRQLRNGGLGKATVKDDETRRYIFERILHPLGDVLSTVYKVPLDKLQEHITKTTALSPDPGDEALSDETRHAARTWRRHLEGVHDAVQHPRFERLPQELQRSNRVKIAILDTGLQLPEYLQEAYIAENKIALTHCKSFCSQDNDWNVDIDGHGTQIAAILLDVAPKVELYVAKICQSRKDFASHKNALQTQQNVAQAIQHAVTFWGVDIIVMSFGFERRVNCIHMAMEDALQGSKPPLFFAATRNDGAHKSMAWPARELFVFGISSTDGNGAASSFNPDENDAQTILYAFGEGIETVRAPSSDGGALTTKFVSGTSFAAAVAAGLAANLLTCVRLGVRALADDDVEAYADLPHRLQRMDGMLKVMLYCMRKKHLSKQMSLLPWDLLNEEGVESGAILRKVFETLDTF